MIQHSSLPVSGRAHDQLKSLFKSEEFQHLKQAINQFGCKAQLEAASAAVDIQTNESEKTTLEDRAKDAHFYNRMLKVLQDLETGDMQPFTITVTTNHVE